MLFNLFLVFSKALKGERGNRKRFPQGAWRLYRAAESRAESHTRKSGAIFRAARSEMLRFLISLRVRAIKKSRLEAKQDKEGGTLDGFLNL